MAAQRGACVMLAEAAALGGTCVNVGCIPKKLYSYAAHFADDFRDAAGFGWHVGDPRFDWPVLKANRAAEIARLNGTYGNLLVNAGVQIVTGWATLLDANTVQVRTAAGVERFSARHNLVCTGGRAHVPQFPGSENVLTSDSMFDLEPFPRRLLVVGGGYIACEFASIFNGLDPQSRRSIGENRSCAASTTMFAASSRRRSASMESTCAPSATSLPSRSCPQAWLPRSATGRRWSPTRCCMPPGACPTSPT